MQVMEIHVITKNVYGSDLFYVKDPEAASVLRRLTGRKTLTRYDIDLLSSLGLKVTVSEEAAELLGWNVEEAWAKKLAYETPNAENRRNLARAKGLNDTANSARRYRDSKRLNGPKDRSTSEEEWWSGDATVLDLDEMLE